MTKIHWYILLSIFFSACNSVKKSTTPRQITEFTETPGNYEPLIYKATNTLTTDLLHTKLELKPDWEKQQLSGKATLTLSPYFYPSDKLILNARGMDLHEISLVSGRDTLPLKFIYQNDSITISLDKTYKKGEEFSVFIDYTAKPEELVNKRSISITNDKGLYFINADGKEKDKPQQIWSQGETQSNSVWFPTIDSPNEKMTQEIYITVDTAFTTLSNGLLLSSTVNTNGTRTDYWKQSLPASTYLTMIAVGKYAVVKDKWRDREVNYYIEPAYEPYARLIFGHTPEMLEFYSKKLGVDYPWEKYAQVVVRDYVSGAMENTTAVVHGEFLQQNSREILDESYEDIIAHELFHHWFGDLVTCESWSNIPLNESFATYGVYLWNEYKYGRDEADYGIQTDLNEYLASGKARETNLIRYNYEDPDELFDDVSYQKGGRVLHMLRKVVGDDAFFSSLKLYLKTNSFKTAEVANLRLAFEEITHQDLNWFFNEWFFNSGQPEIHVSYQYNDSLHKQFVYTEQNQSSDKAFVFTIPVSIDLYEKDGSVKRHNAMLKSQKDTFAFESNEKPALVNFDAEKMLPAIKSDQHTTDEWIYMFNHAPLYLDRFESLSKLSKNYTVESSQASVLKSALSDKHWNIRVMAIKNCGTLAADNKTKDELKARLIGLAETDVKSDVRVAAIKALSKNYSDTALNNVFSRAAGDSSFDVMGEAIRNYFDRNKKTGIAWLKQFENTESQHISGIISSIYAEEGNDYNNGFFVNVLTNAKGFGKYRVVAEYAKFLSRCNPVTISTGFPLIEDVARNAKLWWVRMSGFQALSDVRHSCEEKSASLENEIKSAVASGMPGVEIQAMEIQKKKYDDLMTTIDNEIKDIKKNETDKNLKKVYHTNE